MLVYIFLADGFEITEALATQDVLRRAGIETKLISIEKDVVISSNGVKVIPDYLIDEISTYSNVDAIVLPGGMPGTTNLQKCDKLIEVVLDFDRDNKLVCAICAAPSILGEMGLLQSTNCTCYPGFEEKCLGANVLTDKVVTYKNIITGKGAGASIEFGAAIVEKLISKEKADEVLSKMQY